MFFFVLSGIIGYLIGSVPTAFLLVRWKSNVDIRNTGSGNVGALNSFQVTRSKLIGGIVLLLDASKGAAAVLLVSGFFGEQLPIQATAGVAAVAGHNFPVWLRFKGGRGLATAAGVMALIAWPFVVVWGALWLLGFLLLRHVNVANAVASAAGMVGVIVAPDRILNLIAGRSLETAAFRVFVVVLFIVILIKHIEPVREYVLKSRAQH